MPGSEPWRPRFAQPIPDVRARAAQREKRGCDRGESLIAGAQSVDAFKEPTNGG
jgi:hypothetical protein